MTASRTQFRDKAYLQNLQIPWPNFSGVQVLGAAPHVKVFHSNECMLVGSVNRITVTERIKAPFLV